MKVAAPAVPCFKADLFYRKIKFFRCLILSSTVPCVKYSSAALGSYPLGQANLVLPLCEVRKPRSSTTQGPYFTSLICQYQCMDFSRHCFCMSCCASCLLALTFDCNFSSTNNMEKGFSNLFKTMVRLPSIGQE